MRIPELLTTRRFVPFFFTQLLGALNDNLLRNAMIVMVSFGLADLGGLDPQTVVNLSAGLFILPFFLLSATAGQLADKLDKARLIRDLKLAELGLMVVAAVGLWTGSVPLLLVTLLLMGTQSAFFGPVKYAILPQHLRPAELVAGNAWVELGTFVAIMAGTVLGGLLMAEGPARVALALLVFAALGWWTSRHVPAAPSTARQLQIRYSPWSQTRAVLALARRDRPIFYAILGNSWFWLYGAMLMALLPAVGAELLGGDPGVVTALVVVFSVGVALGSLACQRLSGGAIELGLIPLGALLGGGFGLHLWAVLADLGSAAASAHAVIHTAAGSSFLHVDPSIYIDLLGLGLGGGLFIVPLYALMQHRAAPAERSRIIAANNIVNALFVVAASVGAIALRAAGLGTLDLLLLTVLGNLMVAVIAYTKLADRTLRLCVSALVRVMYRFRAPGIEHIPTEGAALLVCNHISFVDALLIGAASRRPVRFVMDHRIFHSPVLHRLFRTVGTIPIAPRHEDERIFDEAFVRIAQTLERGELVCIFPEGKITHTGELNEFRRGVERILADNPVPVIPMALHGLWGSFFSRKDGPAMRKRPRRFRARVELRCGEAIEPARACAPHLQRRVQQMLTA
ncbi:MAG: MFS transporter [Myxococcota bacterium]